jgi:hypothetical protein
MNTGAKPPTCCDRGAALATVIRQAPATVVAIRRKPLGRLFPSDLEAALRTLPYEVECVVATPLAAAETGVVRAMLGEVLVFARTSLIGRLPDEPESGAVRLCALLRAGLSPYVGSSGRAGAASSWDSDESDAYSIHGKRLAASFAQVGEAWRRRLSDPPSDRTGRA